MSNLFIEMVHPIKGLTPSADMYNTNPASDVVNTKYFKKVVFVIHQAKNATSTAGTATATIEACSSAAGSNAAAVAFKYSKMTTGASDVMGAITDATASGFTTTANEDTMYFLEVDPAELPAGKPYCRLQLTEVVNAPVLGSVSIYGLNPSFAGASMPTALT